MAGSPKKRARREAAESAIPDADEGSPRAPYARSRARAPASGRAPTREHGYVGPNQKRAADSVAARQLEALAAELGPDTAVRIERVRPSWCAGWVEDYVIDLDGLADLYDHIRSEWGGQVYSVKVLLPDGATAFTSRLAIAEPPRHEGRLINRDVWDGSRSTTRENPAPAQPQPGSSPIGQLADFMRLFVEQNNRVADTQLAAVRDLVTNSQAQTGELVRAVVARDEQRAGRESFAHQLGDILEATEALEVVRDRLGTDSSGHRPDENDPMAQALKEATGMFLGNAMGSMLTRRNTQANGGQSQNRARSQVKPRRTRSASQGEVPDAVSGHPRAHRRS